MKFISEMTVKEIEGMQMGSDLMIAAAAWVSTGKSEAVAEASGDIKRVEGVINYLIANRHGTPFEHGALTTYHHHPIFVEREFVRHRIGISINEESARYKKLDPTFYVPPPARPMFKVDNWKPGRPKFEMIDTDDDGAAQGGDWLKYAALTKGFETSYRIAYDEYESNLAMGFDPGLARDCLPVGIYTSCWRTWNPRSIMHFLSLRVGTDESKFRSYPLWEIDQVAQQVETIFKAHWPITHAAFVANGRVAP